MANWNEVLEEIAVPDALQHIHNVRRKYLDTIHQHNGGRNVIAYYSGWLHKPDNGDTAINDKDKAGFMLAINGLDCTKGLDLILHTPGGGVGATESIVDYLYSKFGDNIRAVVPQISMSAGTMIALACKEILMGRHSNLGPIDPQIGGIACEEVIEEFERARDDISKNVDHSELWRPN
jgi:ClpP class serine protease